jgi:DNA-binding transcriptional MerR regulator
LEDQEITVADLARRLGIAPATLRTWDRRYGLGPAKHQSGTHRRYDPIDIARIAVMRRLVLSGVPPKEAALVAVNADPKESEDLPVIEFLERPEIIASLIRALNGVDKNFIESVIRSEILAKGLITTWVEVIVPTLTELGEIWSRTGNGIDSEHLLTEILKRILRDSVSDVEKPLNSRPVVLAAIGEELHCLALHALAAALAEKNIEVHFLGARMPFGSLVELVRKTAPPVVFLWAQLPENADYSAATSLPAMRPAPRLLLGGPGWDVERCAGATFVTGLPEACEMVSSTLGLSV